jgi:GDP-4-dehydro-6-deoxy-D-mannose reductase
MAEEIDLLESARVAAAIAEAAPDVIYHLAAFTHVGQSWSEPELAVKVNVLGTLAVLEGARVLSRRPRVLLVSSAEVYGGGDGTPLDEQASLLPTTPYAASKVAAEYLGVQAAIGRGLEVVRARPFNHVGPGQSDSFVVPGLAKRIALAEASGGGAIPVGNLTSVRDFTDVRDVVRAYRMLAISGISGEVYNISSGSTVAVSALVEMLVGLATVPITTFVDPSLVRPVDVPVLSGVSERVRALTGWEPEIPLIETLRDILDSARKSV